MTLILQVSSNKRPWTHLDRQALQSAVEALQSQRPLLDETLRTSESHLRLVQQRIEEERKRLARRPIAKIKVGKIADEVIRSGQQISVTPDKNQVVEIDFAVTNERDAEVRRPVVIISASPSSVLLKRRGFRLAERADHHVIQFSGSDTVDIIPHSISSTLYRYPVDVTVPTTVEEFTLDFRLYGDNMSATTLVARFRAQQPKK